MITWDWANLPGSKKKVDASSNGVNGAACPMGARMNELVNGFPRTVGAKKWLAFVNKKPLYLLNFAIKEWFPCYDARFPNR